MGTSPRACPFCVFAQTLSLLCVELVHQLRGGGSYCQASVILQQDEALRIPAGGVDRVAMLPNTITNLRIVGQDSYVGSYLISSDLLFDVNTFLPGLSLLMDEYGDVLPYRRALELYYAISELAEQIFTGFALEKKLLCNIYILGWSLAERWENPEYIALYRRKLQAISDMWAIPKE